VGAPETPASPGECERQRGSDRRARTSSGAGVWGVVTERLAGSGKQKPGRIEVLDSETWACATPGRGSASRHERARRAPRAAIVTARLAVPVLGRLGPGASLAMETRRQRCGCQCGRRSLDEGERLAISVRVVPLHEQGDLIHGQCDPHTKGQAQPELAPITAAHDRRAPRCKGKPHAGQEVMYA
jgi:hypothetical protein